MGKALFGTTPKRGLVGDRPPSAPPLSLSHRLPLPQIPPLAALHALVSCGRKKRA